MRAPDAGSGRAAVAVLFLVNVLNFCDRLVLGALAEPVRREFALSDAGLGALVTLFTICYALAGLPLGRWADRGSRKKLLLVAVAAWSALTALGAAAVGFVSLLATRLGVGVAQAACAPAATSWLGDAVPAGRRSRAMAVFMMGVPVGSMLSFAVAGPVAQAWGWRAALLVTALPAVALVPALALLREPVREPAPGVGTSAWSLLRVPAFRWIIVSGALVNFALYAFSTFLPAFLARVHSLTVGEAGVWSGLGAGAAGVAGGLLAGAWGDRAAQGAPGGRLRAAALVSLAAAPAALAGVSAGGAAGALGGLMLAYALLSAYYGLVYAAIQDLVAPTLRASAMAIYFLAMYLCGASFGPLVTGRLSDALARRAAGAGALTEAARAVGLQQAMYVMPLGAVLLAASLWMGSRRAESAAHP